MRNSSKTFTEVVASQKSKLEKKFKEDLSKLPVGSQNQILTISKEVESAVSEINKELDVVAEVDAKYRKAGYLPSQAQALLAEGKTRDIGNVFKFFGKEYIDERRTVYTAFESYFVRTPFNTVVNANEYIKSLQDQLILVAELNNKLTKGSFFDLIKLAFKRLLKGSN